jgi:hypothetical protein
MTRRYGSARGALRPPRALGLSDYFFAAFTGSLTASNVANSTL